MRYRTGDRVKVVQLIKDEPCSDIDVLLNQVGTVTDPAVDDEDWDGNSVVRVAVTLDHKVDMGGYPSQYADDFVFDPAELARVEK
jgi:hypothetical protein